MSFFMLCIEANHFLSADMAARMKKAVDEEESPLGKQILTQLQENLQIAGDDSNLPGHRHGSGVH